VKPEAETESGWADLVAIEYLLIEVLERYHLDVKRGQL
jgi:hypothetical protein